MRKISASREETFSRLFHNVVEKYRKTYRPSLDLIDAEGKTFLSSIDYSEQAFLSFIQDYVGIAEEMFLRYKIDAKWDCAAQGGLGYLYANGLGVERDYAQAIAWYRKAAEQGDAGSQGALGYLFANGLGVERDYAQAIVWYRKAARQGDVGAQSGLGYLYASGLGVERDYAQAVDWHRKAVESGSDYSQFCLGYQYQKGQGVSQDNAQAAIWFRKAADQGNVQAREELDKMRNEGKLT